MVKESFENIEVEVITLGSDVIVTSPGQFTCDFQGERDN